MNARTCLQLSCAVLFGLAGLCAQDAKISVRGPSPSVVKLGDQAQIELAVEGDSRVGAVVLPKVDGAAIEASRPSRQEQSFFDGRTMTRSIKTTWNIAVQPQREGKFTIPPIEVQVDGRPYRTQTLTLEAVRDVHGDKFGYLKVEVQKRRVYVHEPIRVAFEYGIDATLSPVRVRTSDDKVSFDIELSAPWLDAPDGAVLIEGKKPADPGLESTSLVGNRKQLLVGYQANFERQGRRFHRFLVERDYLPSRTGTLKLDGPMLRFQVASGRNQRGRFDIFFEESSGTNYYVYAPPIEVEVLPIPEAGRPSPYLGAVGRFAIAAKCDQPRVKLGAPLRLTFTVAGDGNLEFLGVPALDDLKGLHLLGKKEQRTSDAVVVTYDLRVISPDVKAIPEITYSWFDTTLKIEKFVTEKTAAIPLEVVPLQPGEGLAPLVDTATKAVTPGVDDIFDIMTADGGAAVALARPPAPIAIAFWLVLPWLAGGAIAFAARRVWARRADQKGRRARSARKRCERSLEGGDPHAGLVGYLADRLDLPEAAVIAPDLANVLTRAGVPSDLAGRAARLVESGLAARYGGGGGVTAAAVREVVGALATTQFGTSSKNASSAARTIGVLFALVGSWVGALPAQESRLAPGDGVAAYRRGEYAKAAVAFAKAAAEPGADRRLYYDLGNALFRVGRHAEALLAYERARLALPRDPQVAANLGLVRKRLDLGTGEGESFGAGLAALRDAFTPVERFWATSGLGTLAAMLLVLGWRRKLLRGLGFVVAVPFAVLAVDLTVLGPARVPAGIVLGKPSLLVSEPRAGLSPIAQLKAGVRVEVLGRWPGWLRVAVGGKSGYLPEPEVGVVE